MFDPTVPSPYTTALRDGLKVIGGFLVAEGWMTDSGFQIVAGFVLAGLSIGYAIWKQIQMKNAS